MTIFLSYHLKKYPKMQNQDKIKLIYQASLGPAHLTSTVDQKKAYKYIIKESKTKCALNMPYYEWISDDYLRVNILKEANLKYLSSAFYNSANSTKYDENILKENLKLYLKEDEYYNYDLTPIHHSTIYNEEYMPHYRLIHKKYLTLLMRIYQLYDYVLNMKPHSIISLEGKCASGKTTIANGVDIATIIHADDFFLPPSAKTKERLEEIGGNINYELLKETILRIRENWEKGKTTLSFKAYDCEKDEYFDKEILLKDKVIIEGVYSYHPYFNEFIDKCAYVNEEDSVRINRIMMRKYADKFLNEWIGLENAYFDCYKFLENADIII